MLAGLAAFQRGDIDAAFADTSPDYVFDNRTEAPGVEGLLHGRDGFIEMQARIKEGFAEYNVELLETKELPDRVVLTLLETGRAAASGIEIERRIVLIYSFEHGQITGTVAFPDRREEPRMPVPDDPNVQRLAAAYDVFNLTREVPVEVLTEDVEFVQPLLGEGVYRGREEFVRGVQQLQETFEDFHIQPEEYLPHGETVIALVQLRGVARESGVPIEAPFAHVVTYRDGLIARWDAYEHREEALEAAGIRR